MKGMREDSDAAGGALTQTELRQAQALKEATLKQFHKLDASQTSCNRLFDSAISEGGRNIKDLIAAKTAEEVNTIVDSIYAKSSMLTPIGQELNRDSQGSIKSAIRKAKGLA